jgi:hypothetical protein
MVRVIASSRKAIAMFLDDLPWIKLINWSNWRVYEEVLPDGRVIFIEQDLKADNHNNILLLHPGQSVVHNSHGDHIKKWHDTSELTAQCILNAARAGDI